VNSYDENGKVKFSLKCNGPLNEEKPYHTIPTLRSHRGVDSTASLAVEVFVCMKCHYLEFSSAERHGTNE
jgi:hypothetical protein